jgi:CRISPR-associated protein Csb1
MEPIFKREKYKHLVPQVSIKAGQREIYLLDAGHRAADAIVRFSTLGPKLHEALEAYRATGNAEPLARIAPTSIVFGCWDSRATQTKLPRVVRSVIRAFNIREMHRSAQYSTIAGEVLEEGDVEVKTTGPKAELGLAHVPAVLTHGGVQVLGEIRRDAALNLEPIRSLVASANGESNGTLSLRRYILGLAIVSFTAPPESFLREGCQLVPDCERGEEWKVVMSDGAHKEFTITHPQAVAFATDAASSFGVAHEPISGSFEPEVARKVLNLNEADRKKLLRQGAVTPQAIEQIVKKSTKKG